MDLTHLDDGIETIELKLKRLKTDLEVLSNAFRNYRDQIQAGEKVKTSDVGISIALASKYIQQAEEVESKIAQRKKDATGAADRDAIDLERMRSEIGCRLGNLRQRGCSQVICGRTDE